MGGKAQASSRLAPFTQTHTGRAHPHLLVQPRAELHRGRQALLEQQVPGALVLQAHVALRQRCRRLRCRCRCREAARLRVGAVGRRGAAQAVEEPLAGGRKGGQGRADVDGGCYG